jgi:hypothetical protein
MTQEQPTTSASSTAFDVHLRVHRPHYWRKDGQWHAMCTCGLALDAKRFKGVREAWHSAHGWPTP